MTVAPNWWPALAQAAAALTGLAPQAVGELLRKGDVCLGCEAAGGGSSSLNNDGTPIELCVSFRAGSRAVRLLMDPAHREPDPVLRCERALAATARLLGEEFAPEVQAAFLASLRAALPDLPSLRAWLDGGALWLAADLQGQSVAAYVSARWDKPEKRWARALAWLAPRNEAAAQALTAIAGLTELASIGLEAHTGGQLRYKVYFRLRQAQPLARLGLPGLDHPALAEFLTCVVANRSLRRSGIVLSVTAEAASGLISTKLDLCAHCLGYSSTQWVAILDVLGSRFGVCSPEVGSLVAGGAAEMAFIGLAPSPGGAHRLNCYLKAPSRQP